MKKLENIFGDYKKALFSLKEGIAEAESELEIDGVIQRFEFTFELFWKLLKKNLEIEGIVVNSPRSALKEVYAIQFLTQEEILLKMLDDRNETTHIYNKEMSREIFLRIKEQYIKIFDNVLNKIEI